MSRYVYRRGANKLRWFWRLMRHFERLSDYYARHGRYYLASEANRAANAYRNHLGGAV